jgi:hypothetical protein
MNGQLLEIAIHESGHAVISRVVGLVSGYATISDGNPRSYCRDDWGIRTVLTALAGRAAALELMGFASDEGCSADDRKALALIEADGFRERFFAFDVRRESLLADARALIRKHRSAVERVALALLERETLSGAEIDKLMTA